LKYTSGFRKKFLFLWEKICVLEALERAHDLHLIAQKLLS